MFSYCAYGLGIHSDFALPEFVAGDAQADVVVRLAPVGGSSGVPEHDTHVKLSASEATLAFRGAGVFRIRAGREILVTPAPGVELSLVRLYLVGKVMATLLYQRGLLVLHASAVEVEGKAVAFVGTSGFGKSSLAASLHACGNKIVADDVVAVDLSSAAPTVVPAFPQLKLDPEVASSLGHDKESLIHLHPLESKRGLRVTDMFATTPTPLGLIYLLGASTDSPSDALPPQNVLIELVRHSFPARLLQSGGGPHLRQCASLAKLVPIRRLLRADNRMTPSQVVSLVRGDLGRVRDKTPETPKPIPRGMAAGRLRA
jgi:hypothetical protein